MTHFDEVTRLRRAVSTAIGYLSHFKDDAECNLVSFPETIQKAMDDLQGVLDGDEAGAVFRRSLDFQGQPPALASALQSASGGKING